MLRLVDLIVHAVRHMGHMHTALSTYKVQISGRRAALCLIHSPISLESLMVTGQLHRNAVQAVQCGDFRC